MHEFFHYYGKPLFHYSGRGQVRFEDNGIFECDFECVQVHSSEIVCYCTSAIRQHEILEKVSQAIPTPLISLIGRTDDEAHIEVSEDVQTVHCQVNPSGTTLAFVADKIEITFRDSPEEISQIQFGLMNMMLGSANADDVTADFSVNNFNYSLTRRDDYLEAVKVMKVQRRPYTTCILKTKVNDYMVESPQHMETILIIGFLLSVIMGSKVDWVYTEEISQDGELIGRVHQYLGIKPFVSLPLINFQNTNDVKVFIEITYNSFVAKRDNFGLDYIVGAWLDARLEQTHLQVRGLTLVVIVEMIHRWYLVRHVDKTKGFKNLFSAVTAEIGLNLGPDIKKFVDSRNDLVHRGEFRSVLLQGEQNPPFGGNPKFEFDFLRSVVDEILLKILEYRGKYIYTDTDANNTEIRILE